MNVFLQEKTFHVLVWNQEEKNFSLKCLSDLFLFFNNQVMFCFQHLVNKSEGKNVSFLMWECFFTWKKKRFLKCFFTDNLYFTWFFFFIMCEFLIFLLTKSFIFYFQHLVNKSEKKTFFFMCFSTNLCFTLFLFSKIHLHTFFFISKRSRSFLDFFLRKNLQNFWFN